MSNRITPYLDPIMNPGGVQFPVKRGTWDFVEQGWMGQDASIIQTLIGQSYSNSVVYILYGCQRTDVGGNTSFTSGAIFYNGEIYPCPAVPPFSTPVNVTANLGQTPWQPVDAAGNQYADPVGFIGASAANIHIMRTCNFEAGASGSGTISGDTASDWGNLVLYSFGRDAIYSTAMVSTISGNGAISGTIYYRKNWQNNTMTIYGMLTSATPSDFADWPSSLYYDMGITFPIGYRPSVAVQYFSAYYYASSAIKNFSDTQFMDQFRCAITTVGKLLINWIKPDAAIGGYGINISATISLD